MKQEQMTFPLCLSAVLMGAFVSFSCLMCLIKTYSMSYNPGILVAVCCLISGIAVSAMSAKRSWLITLIVFLIYFIVMIWRHDALQGGFSAALYHITTAFEKCFKDVVVIGERGGDQHLMFVALAVPLAWLTVWTICKESYCIFVILACSPFLILSLIVVDLAPNFWLVLLTASLMLLIMSDNVRIRSASDGGALLLWLMLPTMALFILLAVVSPVRTYVRSDWSQVLQEVAEGKLDVDRWRKYGTANVTSQGDIDLNKIGPRKKDGAQALRFASDIPISYLRGISYGTYEDGTWQGIEAEQYETLHLPQDLLCCEEGAYTLQVKTNRRHDVVYTTYYPDELPESGRVAYDAYVGNPEKLTEYTVSFSSDDMNDAWTTQEYAQLISEIYLQVPKQLQEHLQTILVRENMTDAAAERIAAYVRSVGTYDLNTPRVPEGEDFALYFLEESHQGYCVHFATATTLLLRAAGIPARYVTGYSVEYIDTTWNSVTEDEAHAWVEYYKEGKGWVPLDPTPAQWRDAIEEQEEPDALEPQPEKPDEPQKPEEPQKPKPSEQPQEIQQDEAASSRAGQASEKTWSPLVLLMLVPVVLVLLLLRRLIHNFCRKYQCKKAAPNQRALRIWGWLVRLYKAERLRVPEELICLAEKAKFSQHELTSEEISRLEDAVAGRIAALKKLPVLRRLWHQYGLVLY